jgi:hypothetical protein
MANRKREREHLAEADRHIAQAKAHIARQRELIWQLNQDGHDTELSEGLLQALEHALVSSGDYSGRLGNLPDRPSDAISIFLDNGERIRRAE